MAHADVKSAARVLELLQLFDQAQAPLALKDVVSASGYPQSSAAALLATLVQHGYLVHDRRSHTYVPSTRVAHLGRWIGDDGLAAEPALLRAAEQLHRSTGETAVVAVRKGIHTQYLIVAQRRRPRVVPTEVGVFRPLFTSGTGLALLSTMDAREWLALLRKARRQARVQPIDARALRQRLEAARRHGFVVSRGGVFEDTGMVSAPLEYTIQGQRVALGVGGPIRRLDAQLSHIVQELKTQARGVFDRAGAPR
ncbi:helix-turn-helix domain-containing protein [Verticiella sediminum]|uniref:Helix-turn-helix domain-containing protein n=1 Tax=Verticiella sediminum TaxID=1247510 RepID=A0A556A7B0_9BURK|nr:helix-turn-helix domain-containing protein [Verticiella sediminum]TSH88768.1 helix-turn-helix domain-containing protein [Verticiella sediminum]